MPLPAIRPKLGARRRDQIEATVRRAFEPVATLRHLRVVHAAAERHPFPDVGSAAHRNRHHMMDLAVPDGHRAAARDAVREASGDLLALRFAVAAPRPTEVERHPATIHRLSAFEVVLSAEAGQGAQADGADAFQLG